MESEWSTGLWRPLFPVDKGKVIQSARLEGFLWPSTLRLKDLADWRDSIEEQLRETVKAGASEVSDSDASVRRLAMLSLRNELNDVRRQITEHLIQRAGKDSLFGFRLKQDCGDEAT